MECNFFALKYKHPCNVMISGPLESYFMASLSPLKWKWYLGVISLRAEMYNTWAGKWSGLSPSTEQKETGILKRHDIRLRQITFVLLFCQKLILYIGLSLWIYKANKIKLNIVCYRKTKECYHLGEMDLSVYKTIIGRKE